RGVGEKLGVRGRSVIVVVRRLRDALNGLEAIFRIAGRSPAAHRTRRFHESYPAAGGVCAGAAGWAGWAALAAAAVFVSCARSRVSRLSNLIFRCILFSFLRSGVG